MAAAADHNRRFARTVLVWASLVIIIAGLRASATLVVPFLLALFLAILCGPPLEWLIRHGLRRSLAMLLVMGGLCFVVLILAQVLATTARSFITQWPVTYQPRAEEIADDWRQWVEKQTDRFLPKEEHQESPTTDAEEQTAADAATSAETSGAPKKEEPAPSGEGDPSVAAPEEAEPAPDALQDQATEVKGADPTGDATAEPSSQPASDVAPEPGSSSDPAAAAVIPDAGFFDTPAETPEDTKSQWADWIKPDFLMRSFTTGMRAVSGILSQALLILVTTIFLLMEATTLPGKLAAISQNSSDQLARLERIASEVNQYMAIKTATSLLTGGVVAVSLWLLDVDFALLWGMTAFLLNFVPNIGSIIAAVPAVLLTLLQHNMATALVVVGVYVAVNMFVGYYLEPKWMGRGLGLSTLVVFVSLVFWGWVLGPVGMVISVPLTMAVKIALEGSAETRWLAILMGAGGNESAT